MFSPCIEWKHNLGTDMGKNMFNEQQVNLFFFKQDLVEKKRLEKLNHISVRLEKLEDSQSLEAELTRKKYSDTKMNEKLAKVEKNIWHELESIKDEYREGE